MIYSWAIDIRRLLPYNLCMDSALVHPYLRWYMWAMSLVTYEFYRDEAVSDCIRANGNAKDGWEKMKFFPYRVWRN